MDSIQRNDSKQRRVPACRRDEILGDDMYIAVPARIHSRSDLSPLEKLLFSDLLARLGNKDHAWPSIRTLGEDHAISHPTVMKSLRTLEAKRMLIKHRPDNPHQSMRYELTSPKNWLPDGGSDGEETCTVQKDCTAKDPLTIKGSGTVQNLFETGKDSLSERSSFLNRTTKGTTKRTTESLERSAEEIYQRYPKKVGKADAIRAIVKVLKALPARGTPPTPFATWVDWLIDRVDAYAISRRDEDPKFTAHPSTWFNGGRFDDAADHAEARAPITVARRFE